MDIDVSKYFKPNLNEARKRSRKDVPHDQFHLDEQLKTIGHGKKYLIDTYGCQANEADGETMAGILSLMGFEKTTQENDASVIIINTCAIREKCRKSRLG